MADEADDEQWLYGDNPDGKLPEPEEEPPKEQEEPAPEPAPEAEPPVEAPVDDEVPPGTEDDKPEEEKEEGEEDGEVRQNGEDSDKDDDDDDSDDDVNVVIGDIKATAPYAPVNIKRGALLTSAPIDKTKQVQPQQPGKFNVDEFEQIGTINGVPANEYNLDSLEDKPWRKPGADITDYFNYGFNEDTWKAYCERQKRIRVNESGTGLAPMNAIGLPRGPMPIMNDNSKYSGNFIGGPPPRNVPPPMGGKVEPQKISTIQVMTADRREYSRKPGGFPDMSVPPPGQFEEFQPEYGFNPVPEPFYGGYEPTQDSQWGPPMGPPPHMMGPPMPMVMHSPGGRRESPHRETRDRDRDRDREMSRSRSEKPRDRDRERSHRRERSRSKSRRHRSRSRSPGHRSHRKKKSRRHEDSE